MLIEGGIAGLVGLLTLLVVGAAAARKARRFAVDDFDRDLAQALLASLAAGASGLALFDTFGFPQSAGCFFLLLGMAGCMRRLTMAQVQSSAKPGGIAVSQTSAPMYARNGEP